jgi:hypothetical protein
MAEPKYTIRYNDIPGTAPTIPGFADWRASKRLLGGYRLIAHHPRHGQLICAQIDLFGALTRYPAKTYGVFSFYGDGDGDESWGIRQWSGWETGMGLNRSDLLMGRAMRELGIQLTERHIWHTDDAGEPVELKLRHQSIARTLHIMGLALGYSPEDFAVLEF